MALKRHLRPVLGGSMNFPVCLAPMVGLSGPAIRGAIAAYFPEGARPLWPSEMLSSFRLPQQDLTQLREAQVHPHEELWVPQILGNEERPIQDSIVLLREQGAVAVDINMGCPVQKALRHNYGVALMGDASYAAQVVAMAVGAGAGPVSVKLRAGATRDRVYLTEFVRGLEAAGASWLTLHPRLAEEKRRGHARWEQIGEVRDTVKVPVLGNGDIQTSEDIQAMLSQTHCDGVMVGRAMMARPWIVWQWGEENGWPPPPGRTAPAPRTPQEEAREMGHFVLEVWQRIHATHPLELARRRFQFFLKYASCWLDFGHQLERIAAQPGDVDSLSLKLREFFDSDLAMLPRTNLRQ